MLCVPGGHPSYSVTVGSEAATRGWLHVVTVSLCERVYQTTEGRKCKVSHFIKKTRGDGENGEKWIWLSFRWTKVQHIISSCFLCAIIQSPQMSSIWLHSNSSVGFFFSFKWIYTSLYLLCCEHYFVQPEVRRNVFCSHQSSHCSLNSLMPFFPSLIWPTFYEFSD